MSINYVELSKRNHKSKDNKKVIKEKFNAIVFIKTFFVSLINEIKKHKINYHIDFSISAYNILNKNMKIYNNLYHL